MCGSCSKLSTFAVDTDIHLYTLKRWPTSIVSQNDRCKSGIPIFNWFTAAAGLTRNIYVAEHPNILRIWRTFTTIASKDLQEFRECIIRKFHTVVSDRCS